MKTFFKLLLSLFLLVATALVVKVSLFWWELNHPSPTANLNFIQGATGVRFPPGITQYAEYDDVLGFATAHLTLPHNEIPPFIKQYHFTPTDSRVSSLSDKDVPHLPVPFNKIPSSVNYFLNGQKGEHFWTFVLDSRSGNLWVKVVYPGGI